MPLIECQPGVWTTIPDYGSDQIIEAREKGLYVDTTGQLTIANAAQGVALIAGDNQNERGLRVSQPQFTNPVRVTPSNPLKAASVRHTPV